MRNGVIWLVVGLCAAAILPGCSGGNQERVEKGTEMHAVTDWQVVPSFKFDVLCLLNTATGDSFYLNYYADDYEKLQPQLTPIAKEALANLKLKIKDEGGGIISALLTLYFSATEDSTLDDMIRTVENSQTMQDNLKQTPYYSDNSWQVYESISRLVGMGNISCERTERRVQD